MLGLCVFGRRTCCGTGHDECGNAARGLRLPICMRKFAPLDVILRAVGQSFEGSWICYRYSLDGAGSARKTMDRISVEASPSMRYSKGSVHLTTLRNNPTATKTTDRNKDTSPVSNIPQNYNLALPSLLAASLKSFLKIFPDGLLGTTSRKTTPPLNCL